MTQSGYYRYPAIFKDKIVFVSEDDLWEVDKKGGVARRLTTGLGAASHPSFSPDGKYIAFTGQDEGPAEVYIMPAKGGPVRRVTYLNDHIRVISWQKQGIIFGSSHEEAFARTYSLYCVDPETGDISTLPTGPASDISYGPGNGCIIMRHGSREFGYWKRYRGGTAGELWIDTEGSGKFSKLIEKAGNFASPMWIKERIYFAADHEGHGNIYSCAMDGKDLKRHTDYEGFYVRNLSTDGENIVFHHAGDICCLNVNSDEVERIKIDYASPRTQRARKFVASSRFIEEMTLHPKGHHIAAIARGKPFMFGNWEGGVQQFGHDESARYRQACWLADGLRILVVSDEGGEERLEIYDAKTFERLKVMDKPTIGRVRELITSPIGDEAILTNHRCELVHVNLKTMRSKVLDQSKHFRIGGMDWSACGTYVAYGFSISSHQSIIKIVELKTGKINNVTSPVLTDMCPSFDPEGKYLYFLSVRQFNPSWDTVQFDMCFTRGMRPYLVTLQNDLTNPFVKSADCLKTEEECDEDKSKKKKSSKKDKNITKIDFDGIEGRICAFPVEDGIYDNIIGIKGKAIFSSTYIQSLGCSDERGEGWGESSLDCWDFSEQHLDVLVDGVVDFTVSQDRETLIYTTGKAWRVIKAGEKPAKEDGDDPYTKSVGWVNLSRIKVSIDPGKEWLQMLNEAWRLQRDHFWHESMSDINWDSILKQYQPMIERVGTREEFSDLIWEMQGELGTSHAYVFGGDLRRPPHYGVGQLGCRFEYEKKYDAYRMSNFVSGDIWQSDYSSPLLQPGLNVKEGDLLLAIRGKKVSRNVRPESLLVNHMRDQITLTISDAKGKNQRDILVCTLPSMQKARYRQWVEKNRAYVHAKSKGRIGYVHVPDMSHEGFAEFHRGYLAECERDGLIVDVRYNGGGNVSTLILSKLARKRLGYDVTRWYGTQAYQIDSPSGAMAAITNEYAGSDGDMFSHSFKLLGLGPLIGKRTWGGVIGIWVEHSLVDKGMTSQPEFSFWFKDVGWSIENYGTKPDIEVEILPQDYVANKDPQLDRAIKEVESQIKNSPPLPLPDVKTRPSLKPTPLPKRK